MVDAAAGLTTAEAQLRLARDGPNAIVEVSQHPVWRALKKLWAPVPWMLEAAIVIQLGLNDAAADSDHRCVFGCAAILALILDGAKFVLFRRFTIA